MCDDEYSAARVALRYIQQRTTGPVQVALPAFGAVRRRRLGVERRDRPDEVGLRVPWVLALDAVIGDAQVVHALDRDTRAERGDNVLGRLRGAADRGVADHVEGPGTGHLLGEPCGDQFGLLVPALGQ